MQKSLATPGLVKTQRVPMSRGSETHVYVLQDPDPQNFQFDFQIFCIKTIIFKSQKIQCPPYERFLSQIVFYRSLRRRHFLKSGARKLFLHDIIQSNSIQGTFSPNVNSSGFYNNKTAVHSLKVAVQMCNFSVFYYKFYRFII